MIDPNDRELEEYLSGGSKLSARYREASGENTPPGLDEVVLAQAKAELRRKPSLNRYLAPVALAASVVLAVNLAWNLRQVEPLVAPVPDLAPASPPAPVAAPAEVDAATPAPAPQRKAAAPPAAPEERLARESESVAAQARAEGEPHALAEQKVEAANRARLQAQQAAGAPAAALADAAPPLSEERKIDRLIAYIAGLEGAVFIRNGKEHEAARAAEHLQYKRDKAGDRVKTAGDFIRLCASHSYLSGDAYLIRFADGRTRTAEDVLREELARIEGR